MSCKRFNKGKIQFPVALRGPKTSVLKFPIESRVAEEAGGGGEYSSEFLMGGGGVRPVSKP